MRTSPHPVGPRGCSHTCGKSPALADSKASGGLEGSRSPRDVPLTAEVLLEATAVPVQLAVTVNPEGFSGERTPWAWILSPQREPGSERRAAASDSKGAPPAPESPGQMGQNRQNAGSRGPAGAGGAAATRAAGRHLFSGAPPRTCLAEKAFGAALCAGKSRFLCLSREAPPLLGAPSPARGARDQDSPPGEALGTTHSPAPARPHTPHGLGRPHKAQGDAGAGAEPPPPPAPPPASRGLGSGGGQQQGQRGAGLRGHAPAQRSRPPRAGQTPGPRPRPSNPGSPPAGGAPSAREPPRAAGALSWPPRDGTRGAQARTRAPRPSAPLPTGARARAHSRAGRGPASRGRSASRCPGCPPGKQDPRDRRPGQPRARVPPPSGARPPPCLPRGTRILSCSPPGPVPLTPAGPSAGRTLGQLPSRFTTGQRGLQPRSQPLSTLSQESR
ncbi:collagen alpha-1(I) chain-like [Hippopotamus amphibius kiboko]|uniref:collagen alpha-1(I) chain-like n=1 Tax=Hippopotamus amphibius kiboko TaxID=575201 RepID=UPI00259335C9|nr:collagen alpha-1(I) chain-like [Hippopotamus amphibius kiboko]